jgi:3-isopropylmalate/(R)-2-methylmalate dehydratase large subunit
MPDRGNSATIVEKIIRRAAGVPRVVPGDVVSVAVDFAFAHDSSGPRRWQPLLADLKRGIRDPDRVAIVSDHYVPAVDAESAQILQQTRRFAQEHRIAQFFDMVGICHVVLPEHGLIRPGALIAGGDSHTPTAGAFGAYAAGFGATDMAAIVATGTTWLATPETLRVDIAGCTGTGVVAKDIMLRLCRELGLDNTAYAIEFGGDGVAGMGMEQRMVLCNMTAELGADTGIIAPDQSTLAWLERSGAPVLDTDAALALASDAGAAYAKVHRLDAASLAPQIAAPHSPANSGDVGDFAGTPIDQAYIGACVGAKIDDLRMAARILAGRRVDAGVRLLVAPASQRTLAAASADGTLEILLGAGAILLPSGCGACAGMGAGLLADGEVCISSTNRNFKGRMGHAGARVYLGSPYATAAAAVAGSIIDPRILLADVAVSP